VLGVITTALDAEIETAGDEADDATFNALRLLRQASVADLNGRGAALAPMKTFNFAASLPDVVIAQMIYRDPSRADQLTTQVNEIHPLFMPTSFQALAG
jgi:prophage DNA circulation protein